MQTFIENKSFEGDKITFKDLYFVFAYLYFGMKLGSGMCNDEATALLPCFCFFSFTFFFTFFVKLSLYL